VACAQFPEGRAAGGIFPEMQLPRTPNIGGDWWFFLDPDLDQIQGAGHSVGTLFETESRAERRR
jgi:hypothetical protein